ncbi:uncharacterized protein [Aegilops tauschii subsp. strangulata]|uniref:DUF1618 domain-containing protein n=1 Tax=Aegilops tauschii subsp. strangulata TaxID=200361 RepID=A0A453DYS0_AEGTS|nr:uncharacterized protein LOC109786868 [Aegilops tauschii subsp. strangulata]
MAGSSWMMLDRFVFHRDDEEEGSPFLDDSKAPLRASSRTSLCSKFDILFLPAKPPAISRFYMRWPDGTKSENAKGTELVAAHSDLVLFRQTSFGRLGEDGLLPIIQDHFICVASCETKPSLQLRRLPVCNKPMIFPFGEEEDKAVAEQRLFFPHTVGLIRGHGKSVEAEFAVAQLAMVSEIPGTLKMEAEVCVFRSLVSGNDGDGKWDVRKIPIGHKEDEHKELYYWSTDAVITFNSYICWINYYRGGMLAYDVLEEKPNILYLRLPIVDRPRSSAQGKAFYEVNRSVCPTMEMSKKGRNNSVLKFTDVIRSDGEPFGPLGKGSSFTIHSYTLSSLDGSWDEHVAITSEALWALNRRIGLPRDILMFPLVSMLNSNIAYFLVSESAEEENSKLSLVTIQLSTKKVLAVDPYISREEGSPSGPDADMIEEKSHLLRSFISSRFPTYLTQAPADVMRLVSRLTIEMVEEEDF